MKQKQRRVNLHELCLKHPSNKLWLGKMWHCQGVSVFCAWLIYVIQSLLFLITCYICTMASLKCRDNLFPQHVTHTMLWQNYVETPASYHIDVTHTSGQSDSGTSHLDRKLTNPQVQAVSHRLFYCQNSPHHQWSIAMRGECQNAISSHWTFSDLSRLLRKMQKFHETNKQRSTQPTVI